jgi:hypothetical protein
MYKKIAFLQKNRYNGEINNNVNRLQTRRYEYGVSSYKTKKAANYKDHASNGSREPAISK